MSSKLAKIYNPSRGLRRFMWAAGLLGALAAEALKEAIRSKPLPEHLRFTERDLQDGMPFTVEPGRWTQGGIS